MMWATQDFMFPDHNRVVFLSSCVEGLVWLDNITTSVYSSEESDHNRAAPNQI